MFENFHLVALIINLRTFHHSTRQCLLQFLCQKGMSKGYGHWLVMSLERTETV